MDDEGDISAESLLARALAAVLRSTTAAEHSAGSPPEPLLTIPDAALYLNVSTTTVRNLAVGARIRSARIGDRIRFRRAWLDEWIDAGGGEVPAPPPSSPRPVPVQSKPRPARPRPVPKPKPPTCVQKIGDQELRLLSDKARGTVYTWHAGVREPLCGAVGRWTSSIKREPNASFCPKCMTVLAAFPEADLPAFGVGHAYMMRLTTRGATTTAIRAGYHDGTGRRTLCGKSDGPWALTEREPRTKQCFVCDHRRRWDNRDRDRNGSVLRPITPLRVLVDAGPLEARLSEVAARHPTALDIRQAVEPLSEYTDTSPSKWAAAFARAERIGGFQGPLPGTTSQPGDWAAYTVSEQPQVGLPMSDLMLQRLEGWADDFERASILYVRWATETHGPRER